jgi:two-component system response regulator GlrR
MASILIVDDESSVRTLLTRWMQGLGHEILEAESADAALQVMEKQPAAVVFTDIQMPERDGLWLTAEVRTRYRTTAVVLATSVSAIAPQVSMQAGVLAYLVKPFDRQSVLRALDTALEWHSKTVATGPHHEDTDDRLREWLASLE